MCIYFLVTSYKIAFKVIGAMNVMQALEEGIATQYILRKHHLLTSSQAENVLQVVNDIIALHATSVGTPYLSLFNRMKSFQRQNLDEEFYVKRNLVRLTAMRSTLFITSKFASL